MPSGAVEMEIFGHKLIYCSRKKSILELIKHNEIWLRSIKNYSYEIFVDQLRSKAFPENWIYTSVNDTYQDVFTKIVMPSVMLPIMSLILILTS